MGFKYRCQQHGCSELVEGRKYCNAHSFKSPKPDGLIDHPNKSFYNSKLWLLTRRAKLQQSPLCQAEGCRSIATEVDHIRPISKGGHRTDLSNLQSLCRSCHSKKTFKENKGFKK